MTKGRGLPFWTGADLLRIYVGDLSIMGVALPLVWLNDRFLHVGWLSPAILIAATVTALFWTGILAARRYRAHHPAPRVASDRLRQ